MLFRAQHLIWTEITRSVCGVFHRAAFTFRRDAVSGHLNDECLSSVCSVLAAFGFRRLLKAKYLPLSQAECAAEISLESLIVSSCLFGANGAEQVISGGLLEPFFLNKDTCGI